MAGIGFELNKLARRDDLIGLAGAYLHSVFAIAGPWLFTVVALAFITYIYGGSDSSEMLNFRGVIVYNFSISLVLAAPVFTIMTRYLADQIHVKNVTTTPVVMLESLMLVSLFNLPVAIFFYGFYFFFSNDSVFDISTIFIIQKFVDIIFFGKSINKFNFCSEKYLCDVCFEKNIDLITREFHEISNMIGKRDSSLNKVNIKGAFSSGSGYYLYVDPNTKISKIELESTMREDHTLDIKNVKSLSLLNDYFLFLFEKYLQPDNI